MTLRDILADPQDCLLIDPLALRHAFKPHSILELLSVVSV